MSKEFICVKSVVLSIVDTNQGERIHVGTSFIIVSPNIVRKTNGTRLYEVKNLTFFNDNFIELKRYQYIGKENSTLIKNKVYIFGGIDRRDGQVLLFENRFPKAMFLTISVELFKSELFKEVYVPLKR